MTKQELLSILDEPSRVGKEDVSDLQEFVKEYPYSSVFRMLYLVGLHNLQDVKYANELKSAAFYVSDRQLLSQLLSRKAEVVQPESVAEEPKEVAVARKPKVELVRKTEKTAAAPAPKTPILDIESYLSDKPDSEDLDLTSLARSINSKNGDVPMKNQSIIDKFLEASENDEIRIRVDDADGEEPKPFVPVVDAPKADEEECFTETLARIYIKQHKFEKAIKIFSHLSLKYPEKSVYFADQIRFFEKLIQNYKK